MEAVFYIIALFLGLCFGSFLNVLIVRTPIDKSVIFPPSACPKCDNKLKPYHNIPIISYIFLRGKCAFCGAKISPMYPIIETISAILGLFICVRFGFNIAALGIGMSILLLLALSVIDLQTKQVPDSINFAALIFALVGGILESRDFLGVLGSALSLAGLFTLLRFALQTTLRKESLGEGDIIVVATMGALLGWQVALIAVFLSALFALIILLAIAKKNYQIPFIPFLLLGTFPCVFFTDFFESLLAHYIP